MATLWYYALCGEQKGPVSTEELMVLVASRQLSLHDLIWKKGLAEWVEVGRVRELAALARASTPQTAAQQAVTTGQAPAKTVTQPQTPKESPPSEELRLVPEFDEPKVSQKQQIPQKAIQPADEAAPQAKPAQKQNSQPAQKPQSAKKPQPNQKSQPAQWYYTQNGQQQGPVTAQFLKDKALSGELLPTDHLWKEGLKDWVAAGSLPGLKFPVQTAQTPQPVSVTPIEATLVEATLVEADEPLGSPDANSIFDIMNDPSFATAPAATAQAPNLGLMSATAAYDEKPRRPKMEFEGSFGELGYLLAAFLVPIPLAFVLAYGHGILRYYVGFYIVWYFSILMIGFALSYAASSLFEKANFDNKLVAIGYLLFLGVFVLYSAWATSITWLVNSVGDEIELERQIFTAEIWIHPQLVFESAVEIGKSMESTGKAGKTTSAIPYLILEAIFMAAAPIYATYRRERNAE